jgi:hypothetical protein
MRKAILVVVLVAASFLGGAFVNGPGLQWIEARLLRSLGLNNGGEIALVDLKPAVSSDTGLDELRLAKAGTDVAKLPRAPIPSLLTENESPQLNGADRPLAFQAGSKSNLLRSASPDTGAKSMSLSSATSLIARRKPLEPQAAPVDPNVKQANASLGPVSSGNSEYVKQNAKPDILDTIAALLPSNSESTSAHLPSSSPSSEPMTATKKPLGEGSDSWAVIERKMQNLGVSHYTIDGQPGDRVVFSC